MKILTKILLIGIYPLLLLVWLINLVLGWDRLRLHKPPSEKSCWIKRGPVSSTSSYFSEASRAEGGDESSAARPLIRMLCGIARLYAPPRQATEAVYTASADRDQGIPDEVYTLW
jgi:hypothetical protein